VARSKEELVVKKWLRNSRKTTSINIYAFSMQQKLLRAELNDRLIHIWSQYDFS